MEIKDITGTSMMMLNSLDLSNLNLSKAQIEEEALAGAYLHRTILDNSVIVKTSLKASTITKSSLKHAFISEVDLSFSTVQDSDFTGASFKGSNLEKTVFKNCNLSGVNLFSANLFGAEFKDCYASIGDQFLDINSSFKLDFQMGSITAVYFGGIITLRGGLQFTLESIKEGYQDWCKHRISISEAEKKALGQWIDYVSKKDLA